MTRDARPFALVAFVAAAGARRRRLLRRPVPDDDRARGDVPAIFARRRRCARIASGVTVSIAVTVLGRGLDRDPVRARGPAARAARPRRRRCWSTSSSPPSSPTPPPTRGGRHVRPPPPRPGAVAEQDARGARLRLRRRHAGLLVRRPVPGLAARDRRAADGHVRRRARAGRRPVRVDDQARPRGSRTRGRSSAPTAACSTASTRSCSPSSPATTWRSRSSTEALIAARTYSRSARRCRRPARASRPSPAAPGCAAGAIIRRERARGRSGPRRGRRGGRRRCRPRRVSRWRAARSIRPVIASTRSTASSSSSPAACAWQVSKQKPSVDPGLGVADRLPEPRQRIEAPRDRVLAAGGVLDQHRDVGLEQLERAAASGPGPSAMSSSAWPPWTITAAAPTSAAASQVCCRILREP